MTTTAELATDIGRSLHNPVQCMGTFCTFHNPSEHKMLDWPVQLRASSLIERVCLHGIGHPDPDSAAWMDRMMGHDQGTWSVHGCDGCCAGGFQNFEAGCDFPRDAAGEKTGEGCYTHNRLDLAAGVRCPMDPLLRT